MSTRSTRRRIRSQAGQRRADEVSVSSPKATTHCPLCDCGVPLERFVDQSYGVPKLEPQLVPWEPWLPQVTAKRRHPRKPDGSRGFWWESLTPAEVAHWFPSAADELREDVSKRMLVWLKKHGVLDGKPLRLPSFAWMRGEEAELSRGLVEMPTGLRADARAELLQNPAAASRRHVATPSCVPPPLSWPATWQPRCEPDPNQWGNKEWRSRRDSWSRFDAVQLKGGATHSCLDATRV